MQKLSGVSKCLPQKHCRERMFVFLEGRFILPDGAAAPFAAAPLTAAPSRAFMRFDTSCLPPNDISPSPTTKAGEYAPRLILRGRAVSVLARSETMKKSWCCMAAMDGGEMVSGMGKRRRNRIIRLRQDPDRGVKLL